MRKLFIISHNQFEYTTAGLFFASLQFSSPLALQQLLLLAAGVFDPQVILSSEKMEARLMSRFEAVAVIERMEATAR